MLTHASLFESELKKIFSEELENLRQQLEINDYEHVHQYKFVAGKIAMLRNIEEDLIPLAKQRAEQFNR